MKSPKLTSSGTKNLTTGFVADMEEQIRGRAYELYEQRGRENGHDMDDWLQAEAELNSRKRNAFAA